MKLNLGVDELWPVIIIGDSSEYNSLEIDISDEEGYKLKNIFDEFNRAQDYLREIYKKNNGKYSDLF
jgi:hypothetical protein